MIGILLVIFLEMQKPFYVTSFDIKLDFYEPIIFFSIKMKIIFICKTFYMTHYIKHQ